MTMFFKNGEKKKLKKNPTSHIFPTQLVNMLGRGWEVGMGEKLSEMKLSEGG